jgi:hypothetical protein
MMRDLGSTEIVPVIGSEGAVDPVFSRDGEWISFNGDGKLRKVPARGGPAVDVADSASVGGGAWMPDGNIVFTRDGRGLWIVPDAGGTPRQITTLDSSRNEFNHWYPQSLPDGNAVIYTSYATPIARARIEAFDFSSKQKKVLVEGAVFGRYAAGHLLYMRDGAIFAVEFDPKALRVIGTPVPVQDDVSWVATDGLGAYAIAANGTPRVSQGVAVEREPARRLGGSHGTRTACVSRGGRVRRAAAVARRPLDRRHCHRSATRALAVRDRARRPHATFSHQQRRVQRGLGARQQKRGVRP